MEKANNASYNIHLHYILYQEGTHKMDAKVHNECERHFLRVLEALKQYTGDFNIEVVVPKEGGFIDEFIVSLPDWNFADIWKSFIVATITYYFTKKTNLREDILKGIDIVEKIKSGSLSKEEAIALVAKDKKIKKIVSDYYKAAEQDPQISNIETTTNLQDGESLASSNIKRGDFQTHVIETESVEDTQTIEGTTIAILSPILQKGHGKTWTGIYSGKTIPFKIEDKDFLRQVYNNEIKFGSATLIKCTLLVKRKQIKMDDDPTIKEDFEYIVKFVQTWVDDEHFQSGTKRYKKQKADKRQLSFDF